MSSNQGQVRRKAQESNIGQLQRHEVSGKAATLQNQSLCQRSRWLLAQGRRHRCCRAGCRAASGWKEMDRGTCASVYFYNCHCSKHSQRRNGIFERISVLKKVKAHTKKSKQQKPPHVQLVTQAEVCLTVLYCSRKAALWSSWCLRQSHPYSTRPEKQSWRLPAATSAFLPHLKTLSHLNHSFFPRDQIQENKKG